MPRHFHAPSPLDAAAAGGRPEVQGTPGAKNGSHTLVDRVVRPALVQVS